MANNEKLAIGIKDEDNVLYRFIPPAASDSNVGGIKASPKTTQTQEVKIDPTTNRLYVDDPTDDIANVTGNLTNLHTTNKQNLVGAINEVNDAQTNIKEDLSGLEDTSDNLLWLLNDSFDTSYQTPTYTFTSSRVINDGGEIGETGTASLYGVTNYIDVSGVKFVYLKGTMGFKKGIYAFYDGSNTYISGKMSTTEGTATNYKEIAVTVPSNAKYLVVGSASEQSLVIGFITSYHVKYENIEKYFDNVYTDLDKIRDRFAGFNLLNPDELVDGHLGNDGTIIPNSPDTDWVTSGFIKVYDDKNIVASRENESGSRVSLAIFWITEYDENKEVIQQTVQPSGASNKFVLSDSTKFFRVVIHSFQNNKAMLSYGTSYSTSEYQPFEWNYVIKDEVVPIFVKRAIANLNNNTIDVPQAVDFEIVTNKLINRNGEIVDYSQDAHYTISTVEVEEGIDRYRVTASANFSNCYYVFTNSNRNIISKSESSSSGSSAITTLTDEIISVPDNARYLTVANIISATTPTMKIEKVIKGLVSSGMSQGVKNEIQEMIEAGVGAKKWSGKKWVCVGDSLTEVNSRTTKHYHDYVAESTGITVVNMGVSGSGYKRKEDTNKAFYQRVTNIPTDADVVTIFGSGNDNQYVTSELGTPSDTGTDTLCGCMNTTIDTIIGLIPNVSLGIVSPTPWVGNKPTLDDTNTMARYSEALRQICKIRSIPYLDLYHCSNLRPWTEEGRQACYTKDEGNGVHPDETGHKLIAPRFKAFLETLIL